mmetsp:Transcript_44400/g.71380  ORF Transcript_44400/g.71380 Transcript_44400/m.71380 type:complete len:213 (+) Transcript_44400:69-707(+)
MDPMSTPPSIYSSDSSTTSSQQFMSDMPNTCPFKLPINYDSFYLLPTAMNARPGMRFGPGSNTKTTTSSSYSGKQHISSMNSPPNLASRLSAKAKSFVPKSTNGFDRKKMGRDVSPAKSETSQHSKYLSSNETSPQESPSLEGDDDLFNAYEMAPKGFRLQRDASPNRSKEYGSQSQYAGYSTNSHYNGYESYSGQSTQLDGYSYDSYTYDS